jgi:hypothetical protein
MKKYNNILKRFFNKLNLHKILTIFIVGFISRIFINYFYSINVFTEYLTFVSVIYYIFMSVFIFIVHELTNYFSFSLIYPFSFINWLINNFINTLGNIIKIFISINIRMFSYKLEDIKISYIIKGAKHFVNRDKKNIYMNQFSVKDNTSKIPDNESLKKSSYTSELIKQNQESLLSRQELLAFSNPNKLRIRGDKYMKVALQQNNLNSPRLR